MRDKISSFLYQCCHSGIRSDGFDSACTAASFRCCRWEIKQVFVVRCMALTIERERALQLMKTFWERSPKINMCSVGKMKRK